MAAFRLLRDFNAEDLRPLAGNKSRPGPRLVARITGDGLAPRLVRALADERALPLKEITEAFEFFAVVRRHLRRATHVADLCSGHGLAGLLFGIYERGVESVRLVDRRRPERHDRVLAAIERVAPWALEKTRYLETRLDRARDELAPGSTVLGVHACGRLTDDCLDMAHALGGPVAVLPCCRPHAKSPAPEGLSAALGPDVAFDVHRTYRMEERGYRVRWREIPAEITPMNRVLIGVPRGTGGPS